MKKLIFFLLISLCLLCLVFLSGCKAEDVFDITGRWSLNLVVPAWGSAIGFITFSGSVTSGTLTADFSASGWEPGNGTYTVTGTNVFFTINWTGNGNISWCTGTTSNNNTMSGTSTELYGDSGTWTATR